MTSHEKASLVEAIYDNFTSPNESDSNWESANVVDGLFAIARSIERLAMATRGVQANERFKDE